MFYNEEIKDKYLQYRENNPGKYTVEEIAMWFHDPHSAEKKSKKDLAEFTPKEIIEMYKKKQYTSGIAKIATELFSEYTEWIKESQIIPITSNSFKCIKESDYRCLKDNSFDYALVGKKYIDKFIDFLINPRDKFIIQAMFEGVNGRYLDEVLLAKIEHINFEKLTMDLYRLNEEGDIKYVRTIPISRKLADLAKVADEITQYKTQRAIFQLKGENIVKWKRESNLTMPLEELGKSLGRRIKEQLKEAELVLDPQTADITKSGLFYKLREVAAEEGISLLEATYLEEAAVLLKNYGYESDMIQFRRDNKRYLA